MTQTWSILVQISPGKGWSEPSIQESVQIKKSWVTVGNMCGREHVHALEGLEYQVMYNSGNEVGVHLLEPEG
jgi:hypothetical protein